MLIIDRAAFEAAGATADPGTVWAVGPGAASALKAVAKRAGTVDVLSHVTDDRRSAPLASGLVDLARASSLLLIVFAVLGVALAAAAEAPTRAESLGRLRSLGLGRRDVRRVLLGELVTPVLHRCGRRPGPRDRRGARDVRADVTRARDRPVRPPQSGRAVVDRR